MTDKKVAGFTLLEMSIVIVIIGLVIAGITAGRSIVRGAEFRSVVTEAQAFNSGINAFKDQFGALPGDIEDATEFWPDSCTDAQGNTCNGNGNGNIVGTEGLRAWQHLTLANVVPGDFDGELVGNAPGIDVGNNVPRAKIEGGGWRIVSSADNTVGANFFTRRGNFLLFGAEGANTGRAAILLPRDARGIDAKMDDGNAQSGDVFGNESDNNPPGTCIVTANTVGDDGVEIGEYDRRELDPTCTMLFFIGN